jgi:hypothetical protein
MSLAKITTSDPPDWYQLPSPSPANETKRLRVGVSNKGQIFAFQRAKSGTTVSDSAPFILCFSLVEFRNAHYFFEEDRWENASWADLTVHFTGPFSKFNDTIRVTTEQLRSVFLEYKRARRRDARGITQVNGSFLEDKSTMAANTSVRLS